MSQLKYAEKSGSQAQEVTHEKTNWRTLFGHSLGGAGICSGDVRICTNHDPYHHRPICLQSPNPAVSTLAQGDDWIHFRCAACWEIARQRGHCK